MRCDRSGKPLCLSDDMKEAFTERIFPAIIATITVVACGSPAAYAQGQGFAQAGPIDPATSFPQFYQDMRGRALEQCLDASEADLCGIAAAVPNPAQPIVFPTNFPPEFFYWRATARIRGLGGNISNRADLMMGLGGAFAPPGTVADGRQIVFARWHLRIPRGLVANATYTVTHPFGVKTIVTDATGAADITDDQGCVSVPPACGFALALAATNLGPFLTWDSTGPAPPVGFIGDPNIDHTVTGSPFGINVFRIDGPNVAGPNRNTIQTNLFAITGKPIAGVPTTPPAINRTYCRMSGCGATRTPPTM
jgi:hypothetical protein